MIPTAAPQEGLEQKCKDKVSAPSGTITGTDPFSLAEGGQRWWRGDLQNEIRLSEEGRMCERWMREEVEKREERDGLRYFYECSQ